MKKAIAALLMALLVAAMVPAGAEEAIQVDPDLPEYEAVEGVSGNLNSMGSDTLNNLMALWSEGFRRVYPNVNIQVEGKGSGTAPVALIAGTAQLGPMSRAMRDSEIDEFEDTYGFPPLEVSVGIDTLAVYVHKDNPTEGLSFEELDAIFSSTRNSGYPEEITTWGQVGLTGPWANRPMRLYGRNSASGTYAYFKDVALFRGDFKDTVNEQPGSASVVQGVTEDINGIGYSGIGYRTSGVKAIALGVEKGDPHFEPTYENVVSGDYPLSRMLYIYVSKNPTQPMDTLTKEFLKFVLSKEGQEIVARDGFLPLPAAVAESIIEKLEG